MYDLSFEAVTAVRKWYKLSDLFELDPQMSGKDENLIEFPLPKCYKVGDGE